MIKISWDKNSITIEGLESLLSIWKMPSTLETVSIVTRDNCQVVAVEETTIEEPPTEVKRGRGRPKKEATPEPAVEPTPEPKPVSVREDLLQDASTEAKASTPPADKPKSGKLTKEDATRVGAGVMRTHGPAALKNILQSLGVERASLLSEEQIPEFVEMCEMLE